MIDEERLIARLERLDQVIAQLSHLSRAQQDQIAVARTDDLLSTLARRQDLVTELTAGQDEVMAMIGAMTGAGQSVSPSGRQRVNALLAAIGGELADVLARDAQAQRMLGERSAQIRAELAEVEKARSARSAYAGGQEASNRFADQRG